MKKIKRIPLGILNVTATPHDKTGITYVHLFQEVVKLEGAVKIRGDECALLASFVLFDESEPLNGGFGEIHKYTMLKGDWENTLLRKKASEDDLRQLVIPKHMQPNREAFRYFLFPREHRMVFQMVGERRAISSEGVKRLLIGLFGASAIRSLWPRVDVVVEQEPSSWDRIMKISRLNRLFIEIEALPNTGENFTAQEENFVETLLVNQNAKSLKVDLTHAPGASLIPNDENKLLGRVATKHGKAIGIGRDENNRPIKVDTSEHPLEEPFDYNPKIEVSLFDQMRAAAVRLVDRALNRRKNEDTLPPKNGTRV